MNTEQYIDAFKAGTLNRPAYLNHKTTLEQFSSLIRALGSPKCRMVHGEVTVKDSGAQLLIVLSPVPANIDNYYHARMLDDFNSYLPNVIVICGEKPDIKGVIEICV